MNYSKCIVNAYTDSEIKRYARKGKRNDINGAIVNDFQPSPYMLVSDPFHKLSFLLASEAAPRNLPSLHDIACDGSI